MTSLDKSYVDAVDEKQREFIEAAETDSHLTSRLDKRALEVFTAPSKHVRDVYHVLWMEALGNDYSWDQQVESGALNQWHHNTSVLADDFMDNDDERRGVTAFHDSEFLKEGFPEQIQHLTITQVVRLTSLPYALLNDTKGYFSDTNYESSIPQEDQAPMSSILAFNVTDLASGQIEDLTGPERLVIDDERAYIEGDTEDLTIEEYWLPMAKGKTGQLFEAAAGTGAVAASYVGREPWRHAEELGILLQYTDDLIDLQKDGDKDFMSDFVEGKPTMIVHYAMEEMEGYERERVRGVLESENPAEEDLKEARSLLEEENIIDIAYNEARRYAENANEVLDQAPIENPEYAKDIEKLTNVVLERAK